MRLLVLLLSLFMLGGCTTSDPLPDHRVGSYFPVALDLNINGQTKGDVLVRDTNNWTRLGAGTSGQVLETLGPGVLPTWVNQPAGFTPGVTTRLTPLDANHIHAWELQETSGTTLADTGSSTTKVPFTIGAPANARLGAKGILGNAIWVGTDTPTGVGGGGQSNAASIITAPIASFVDLPLTNWTIESWHYNTAPPTAAQQFVFYANGVSWYFRPNTGNDFGGYLASSNMSWSTGSIGLNTTSLTGEWTYIALTYDNVTLRFYFNGELMAAWPSTGNTQWTYAGATTLGIGGDASGNNEFHGEITRVRLSNITRSQSYLRSVFATAKYL